MLPIKLKIPEGFLEEEERNGYTVSREMKELWAVSLDLMREILEACEAKGIKVFAGYGTLLGAVRHGGFIPWDNDSDLFMMREDYERFLRETEFKAPYFLQTEETDAGFSRAFARLRNSDTTCIQAYEKDLNIPYNQGVFVDIFPLDYMPDDREVRAAFGRDMLTLRNKAMFWSAFTYRSEKKRSGLSAKQHAMRIISKVSMPLLRALRIRNPYIRKMEKIGREAGKTSTVGERWFYKPEEDIGSWPAEYFSNTVTKPFEMLEIPVPAEYEKVLEGLFGDWRTPVMAADDHGELIFDCHKPYREYLPD